MRSLFVMVLCASLLFYAGDTFPQSDEICCTWINTEYESSVQPAKMIFNYDGTFETYPSKDAIDTIMRGVFLIDEKWKDSDGVVWYKVKMIDMHGAKYNLVRISNEGDSLEFVNKPHKYPNAIDKDASNYSTYSRTFLKSFEKTE